MSTPNLASRRDPAERATPPGPESRKTRELGRSLTRLYDRWLSVAYVPGEEHELLRAGHRHGRKYEPGDTKALRVRSSNTIQGQTA